MVRAAAARHQDGAALDRLVATDPHSVVRVGAAAEALDRHPTRDRARDYLTATDPLVQAIGAEMLAATGTQTDQALLLELVEQTDNEDTLRAGLAAIHAVSGGSLPRQTQARLDFLAQHPAPRIQAALTGAVDPEVRPAPQADRASSSGGTWMAHVDTSRGVFRIELRADWAPVAVENFIQLARDGFFDGQVFHRVVPGFVVQTGCPRGDGWGGPGHSIPDEVTRHPYVRGSVGMARAELNSAGSQWFVTTSDQPHLAGLYTQFGSVVQGRHVPQRLTVGDHIVSIRIEEVPH